MKRVLLTTGGTGGHIFPALAVAEELRSRHPGMALLFMGSLYGPERRLAENAGIDFVGLPVRGFLGRGLRGLAAAGRMLAAIPKALVTVRRFAPDAVAGFGSYAAFAPLVAARALRVPGVLHEQNAVAGVSNRLLSRLTDTVCVSLPGTQGFEGRRVVVTGNPVRKDIFAVGHAPRDFSRRHLLVVGGSQGAHALNRLVVELLPELKKRGISVYHQTGPRDEAEVAAAYGAQGMTAGGACRVSAFIDDMPSAYAWADLALCRAGASTVAELCGAALPSLLVPFPYAAHDHQTFNAKAVEGAGAARLLPEAGLTAEGLLGHLDEVLAETATLSAMSKAALSLAKPDAAALVVDQLEAVCGEREGRARP